MYIKPFAVEEMDERMGGRARDTTSAETCVDSVSLNELFALTGEDKAAFLENLAARRLTYGDIEGAPRSGRASARFIKRSSPKTSSQRTARRARTTMCSARSYRR